MNWLARSNLVWLSPGAHEKITVWQRWVSPKSVLWNENNCGNYDAKAILHHIVLPSFFYFFIFLFFNRVIPFFSNLPSSRYGSQSNPEYSTYLQSNHCIQGVTCRVTTVYRVHKAGVAPICTLPFICYVSRVNINDFMSINILL